ncbi:MAG: HupE/UreJ family protein [Gemmatimonadota bacterium]
MGSEFAVFLRLGFDHIADLRAWDHILFIVALSAGYGLAHWRQLLVLVTAFTVGHSLTLLLATLRLVSVSAAVVEPLIAATILATAAFNLAEARTRPDPLQLPRRTRRVLYAMALCFGLIHGLGFSSFLRALLGQEEAITVPLLAFNLGLEAGQLVILAVILLTTHLAVRVARVPRTRWITLLSGSACLAALFLLAGHIGA